MKKILVTIVFIWSTISFSQEKKYFYTEISDLNLIPKIVKNINGTVTLTSNNPSLNQIFSKYIIYNFEYLAPDALESSLRKTFSIECNDIKLMNDLYSNFSNIFIKVEQYQEKEILYTPNDFLPPLSPNGVIYSPSGSTPYNNEIVETRHLDVIRAKEAWDITHGSPNTIIGINDNGAVFTNHEDLINKVVYNTSNPLGHTFHATAVAGFIASKTDNGLGVSSIGFDCKVAAGGINEVIQQGAKVVNLSWGSPYVQQPGGLDVPSITEQNYYTDLNNQGIVLIAAAGNGVGGNASVDFLNSNGLAINAENFSNVKHFPASYKNVIAVSTVGNWSQPNTTIIPFDNWIDVHKIRKIIPTLTYRGSTIPVAENEIFNQHNDSIDIVVPAYRLPVIGNYATNAYEDTFYYFGHSGTSFSAPIVSGTVGLMFSVNDCLKPKEVESILKLTAVDIENMLENQEFTGRLGAGRLDAFKAVEMANEMAKPYGQVNVTNRLLYRNWFYKLETAPFEIKMSNNLITEGAKVKFIARDNIEILSGDYQPNIGYVELYISNNTFNCTNSTSKIIANTKQKVNISNSKEIKLYPNPNNGIFTISVSENEIKNLNIELFDIFGKSVYKTISNFVNTEINISNIPTGIYIVKLTSEKLNEILKLIKE